MLDASDPGLTSAQEAPYAHSTSLDQTAIGWRELWVHAGEQRCWRQCRCAIAVQAVQQGISAQASSGRTVHLGVCLDCKASLAYSSTCQG